MSELIGSAFFQDNTSNSGTVSNATFSDTASNSGAVTTAAFEGNASNSGTILQAATFSGSSTNSGAVSGSVVFSGSAVNVGIVEQAVFLDGAANTGTISLSASFFGSSSNTGTIAGDAVFADTTSNSGTVQGSAQVAETASNTGTVDGSVTTYVQPDGAWANGYFYSGNKTGPYNYNTVAYEVQGLVNVWYVYDYYGNGSLANGVYNDGTSDFVFVNGIKTVAYEIPATFYLDSSTASRTVEVVGSGVSMLDLGNGVKAASFDGGSYLRIQDSSAFNFGSGNFTVEFFFRRNQMTSGGEETIVSTAYPVDGSGIWLGLGFYGVGSLGLYAGGGGWAFGYGLLNLFAANSWIHAALTRVGNQFRMYHNGMLVWTQENGVTLNNANNQILIGGRGGQFFTGDLAGLRIVKGTALYTGSTYTVPTTLLTNVSNTELLLNFGAVNVPTVGSLSGAYSLGYAINNFIDSTYTNSTPQQAQDDSLYYTYASGIGTLANNTAPIQISGVYYTFVYGATAVAEGVYSNGAYVAGAVDTGGTYDSAIPVIVQDNAHYYTFASGIATLADGAYSNYYFDANGDIDTGGVYNTSLPTQAQDDGLYYTYANGPASQVGLYFSYYSNGVYSAGVKFDASNAASSPVPVTVTAPVQAGDTFHYYTYLYGGATLAVGAFSNGYYDANGDLDTTYNNGAPAVAEDSLYYTYASGVATAAEGIYSNGAYVAGAVDTGGTYDSTTPAVAENSLYYTYASGVATAAEGRYSTGAYVAGAVDTGGTYDGIGTAQDDSVSYSYTAGVVGPTLYSQIGGSYYSADETLVSGTSILRNVDNSLASSVSGTYNNSGTFSFGTGNATVNQPWVTDASGVITWYENSVSILGTNGASFYTGTLTSGTTVLVSGNLTLWANEFGVFDLGGTAYEYTTDSAGVVTYTILADGNYSFGSYSSGSLDTTYNSSTPVTVEDNAHYYTFTSGVAELAVGAYSDGYYDANGDPDTTYDNAVPQMAENNLYYTYADGVAAAAEGRYSNGAYVAGAVDTGGTYDGTGTAQDDSQTYTYSSGAIV
jgi:hypothetical protein